VQITFFPEAHAALAERGYISVHVRYLFTRPLPAPVPPTVQRIFYAAEVDISDSCFEGIALGGHKVEEVSRLCWDIAEEVIEGRTFLSAADRALAARLGDDISERSLHRAALWALRNRVRYLLVKAVSRAFGSRLQLHHGDWVRLGLPADAARLRLKACMANYSRFRVSLDVGGKSSHTSIYPRVADILASAGGLVQFLSTGVPELDTPVLPERQATTVEQLLTAVEHALQAPVEQVHAENLEMFDRYRAARLQTGARLISLITEHSQARR
jgi:hypothetical protein